MKSHALAHEGQYGCQKGCKEKFITLRALDEHHKNKHPVNIRRESELKCNICKSSFLTIKQVKDHMNNKHAHTSVSKCKMCGFVANDVEGLRIHSEQYHEGFHLPRKNICKYFIAGNCLKGSMCRFEHQRQKAQNESSQNIPNCRNGVYCDYFYRGRCRYFHRGTGIQNPGTNHRFIRNTNPNNRGWCKYLEDCFKVPNCQFKHYDKDFPELSLTNNPPIMMMNRNRY